MSHYHHITIEERELIYLFRGLEMSISEIAQRLDRNRSTISRELRRNAGSKYTTVKGVTHYYGYRPSLAQEKYRKRRRKCHKHRLLDDPDLRQAVRDKLLNHQWSPEQIAKRLELELGHPVISYPTIYRGVHNHLLEEEGKHYYPYSFGGIKRQLRHKGKKRRKSGEGKKSIFKIEHHLKERPEEANNRERIGDFEADTVIGVQKGACMLTLVDRKSRFLIGKKLHNKKTATINRGIYESLKDHIVHTITPDRGIEFSNYKEIEEELDEVMFYFPPPAHPWERGTNENTNGLLRQYLPKGKDMTPVEDTYIQEKILELNLRPRKCLDWKTPYEVYYDTVLHLV